MPRHFERDEASFCSGHGVGAQEFIGEHREAIDPYGFQSLVEGSGLARSFDPCLVEAEILFEDRILERDRQREDAVEPALDRGEIVGRSPIWVFETEARSLDEVAESGGFELAVIELSLIHI